MATIYNPDPVILVGVDGQPYTATGGSSGSSSTKLTDSSGANTAQVKPASTASQPTDTALVVAQSPNSPTPAGDSVIGRVKVTDGTNVGAVKAASTPAAAADPSQVVSLHPSSPLPAGTNALGSVTIAAGSATLGTVNTLDVAASGTPVITTVAVSTTNATLTASSSSRRGVFIYNAGTNVLFVAFGATATTNAYTMQLAANALQYIDRDVYTGAISGILSTGTGNVQVTVTN